MKKPLQPVRDFLLSYQTPKNMVDADVFYYKDQQVHYVKLNSEVLAKSLRNEIMLFGEEVECDDFPLGSSKIYGEPHLPIDWEWPEHNYFIAQFNLEDLKTFDWENLLPETGMLYIFIECDFCEDEIPLKAYYYDGPLENLEKAHWPSELLDQAASSLGLEHLVESPVYKCKFKNCLRLGIHPHYEDMDAFLDEEVSHEGVTEFLEGLSNTISEKFECICSTSKTPHKDTMIGISDFDEHDTLGFFNGQPAFVQMEEYPFFEDAGEPTTIYTSDAKEALLFRFSCFEGYANLFITKDDLKNKIFENTQSYYSGG
ncbi:MAG: DUF1963 domain-containing protein [Bacteroidota bacterium]